MNKEIVSLVFAAVLCSTAIADVFKCRSPEGKTLYSDEPCGRNGMVLSNLGANTLPALPAPVQRQQPIQAQPQHSPGVQIIAGPAPFVADAYSCNLARRNADTTASSSTADPKRVEIAEREANIACYGTSKAGEIEEARAGATKVIINNTRAVQGLSRFLTHCAGVYCYDNLGGKHRRLRP